jgi:hypothetical protein
MSHATKENFSGILEVRHVIGMGTYLCLRLIQIHSSYSNSFILFNLFKIIPKLKQPNPLPKPNSSTI